MRELRSQNLEWADEELAAGLEHGPIALVEPGYQVLAVAVSGPTLAGLAELLPRLRADGARLLVVSDDASVRELADDAIPLDAGVPEWLSPAVSIVPCQLLAYHLAVANGRDPDSPRRLHKVTLTR